MLECDPKTDSLWDPLTNVSLQTLLNFLLLVGDTAGLQCTCKIFLEGSFGLLLPQESLLHTGKHINCIITKHVQPGCSTYNIVHKPCKAFKVLLYL